MKKKFAAAMFCSAALAGLAWFNAGHVQAATVDDSSATSTVNNNVTNQTNNTNNNQNLNNQDSQSLNKQNLQNNYAVAASAQTRSNNQVNVQSQNVAPKPQSAQYVPSRSYGVDVSSYQGTDLSGYRQNGAQYAIVKVSEGTSYRNPCGAAQIASAKANDMMPMAYHFATFGNNAQNAFAEANYAVSSARAMGLPNGSYLACDWETGDGNYVNGDRDCNTTAVMAFMSQVGNAGYLPMIYSGAYLLRNNLNVNTINANFPNSIWVASYPTMAASYGADFDYFPSMDGVAIWQFASNWRGMAVDANINVIPLSQTWSSNRPHPQTPTYPTNNGGKRVNTGAPVATVSYPSSIAIWNAPKGHTTGRYLANGTAWEVTQKAQIQGDWWYNLGGNQWVPGDYVMVTGFAAIPEKTDNADYSNKTNDRPGTYNITSVGTVNYVPNYGIMVWSHAGGGATGRYLLNGTAWKVFKKTVLADGSVWYNLGGNQWAEGKYLQLS
ncbi:MAG: GH25 family lysozyme [Lactobacillus sp.]